MASLCGLIAIVLALSQSWIEFVFALFRPRSARRMAPYLYARIVAAARAPVFYREFGVADTIEGRYEMIVLHVALLLRRLRDKSGADLNLAQAIVDFFASDLDRSMRELGVGDLGVGRFMKRLGEGLYGRAAAYDAALDNGDNEKLSEALLRNVYNGVNPPGIALVRLARYVQDQSQHLALQSIDPIKAGNIDFMPPSVEP
jgi:cytochrome b pre-mRNA-processing protein 3